MKRRKQYSAAFKLKAVLELLKETKTIPQLASELEVHPTMLHAWRREFMAHAPEIFQDKRSQKAETQDAQRLTEHLYRQIGQLTVEVDVLKQACDTLNVPYAKKPSTKA
jgi:transposase-like protein